MHPVKDSSSNTVFTAEGCVDLPAHVDFDHNIVTTVWEPSFAERLAIARGERVVVQMITEGTIPPVRVTVSGHNNDLELE